MSSMIATQKPSEAREVVRLKLEAIEQTIESVEAGLCHLQHGGTAEIAGGSDPEQILSFFHQAMMQLFGAYQERSLIDPDLAEVRQELGAAWENDVRLQVEESFRLIRMTGLGSCDDQRRQALSGAINQVAQTIKAALEPQRKLQQKLMTHLNKWKKGPWMTLSSSGGANTKAENRERSRAVVMRSR